jgi:tRNA pseudouridine55 synthase
MKGPSGILPLDKPPGPTSHDLVSRVRKVGKTGKVGHAGTLDPFASGLLVLLVGGATRLAEYFLPMDKEYEATARLGARTLTDDTEGEIVQEREGAEDVTSEAVEEAMAGLRGAIEQAPPVYSAKKVRGKPAHRRARRGETVTLEPVNVTVHELELLDLAPPNLRFRVRCSSGTYVRALARDLGEALGPGAHLTALRRTKVGALSVEEAHGPASLDGVDDLQALLTAPQAALDHFPTLEAGGQEVEWLRQGRFLPLPESLAEVGGPVLVLRGGELVAVVERCDDRLRPRKVFAHA